MIESAQISTITHKQTGGIPKNNAPIGLFDSGVGGLSIYKHIYHLLPNEHYLYFADTKNVPYGGRDHQNIVDLTLQAVDWLYQRNCKLIVIACNSASAHGLKIAREHYPNTPIVGLVPALKPAIEASQTKHVAVLATQATLAGTLLNEVITEFAIPHQVKVTKHFNPDLVPWVEAGMPNNHPTANTLKYQLQNFYEHNVDQLVLGCTHYPFFRKFLEEYLQNQDWKMSVVDSGQAIALRVKQLLSEHQLLHDETQLTNNLSTIKDTGHTKQYLDVYSSLHSNQLDEVIARLIPQKFDTPIHIKSLN